MFYTLNSLRLRFSPVASLIDLVYYLAASRDSFSLLAPVMTIFPFLKIKAVVLAGSFYLMIRAANLLGLYCVLRHLKPISFKSNPISKLAVDTRF